MATAPNPAASGGEAGLQQPPTGAPADPSARPGRRPRAGKDESKTLELDFNGHEELLADLRALEQLMKFDLREYIIEAVTAKCKTDTERVRRDFGSRKGSTTRRDGSET